MAIVLSFHCYCIGWLVAAPSVSLILSQPHSASPAIQPPSSTAVLTIFSFPLRCCLLVISLHFFFILFSCSFLFLLYFLLFVLLLLLIILILYRPFHTRSALFYYLPHGFASVLPWTPSSLPLSPFFVRFPVLSLTHRRVSVVCLPCQSSIIKLISIHSELVWIPSFAIMFAVSLY